MKKKPKVSKKQLLKMIRELERLPQDRVRILGDVGISTLGAGLGAAAAGTVAGFAGVTGIPLITAAASLMGVSAVAATPIGWAIGAAAVGGALAYGISRLIHGGAISEGRKRELLLVYRERLAEMEAKERMGAITGEDRTAFLSSLREVIEKDVISVDQAFRLIEAVENGTITLPDAYRMVSGFLLE
jgi:hypothetical protein